MKKLSTPLSFAARSSYQFSLDNPPEEIHNKAFNVRRLRRYVAVLLVLWTTGIAALFLWSVWQQTQQVKSIALAEARAYINRDEAFRHWVSSHGGVYVPVDERTPPNPLLAHIPERDLITPAGIHLTLMNSAYVLRQISQDYTNLRIATGHLTSLNPHRAENAPDDWERAALEGFELGKEEVFDFFELDGVTSLRLMRPIMTQQSCLKCHAQQGYQVGDIRGGVAVSLPTDSLWAATRQYIGGLGLGFGGLWMIGLLGIALSARRFLKDTHERQRAEEALRDAYDATIEGWSRAMDLRDHETEGHTRRVADMTLRLGRVMGLSEGDLAHIRRGALLHDIGKMGIPDGILLKPGSLNAEEWEVMRRHPSYAYEMLSPIVYLRPALDIPYCHHEKWDGSGYPRGLMGEEIPLAARIFAIADVWDALSTDRPYRKAWAANSVHQYIVEQSGKHFDPRVVQAYLTLMG